MNGILTVGELKALIANQSDDTQIVVASDTWFLNISSVRLPDETNLAIELGTTDNFEATQF